MSVRGVGIDVAEVSRFRRLLNRRGDRFAEKWFVHDEVYWCARRADPAAALATHFAVKEAVWKALAPTVWSSPLPWRSISYHADRGAVSLHGSVLVHAGSVRVHTSVTSVGDVVIATALVTAA